MERWKHAITDSLESQNTETNDLVDELLGLVEVPWPDDEDL